MHFGVFSRPQNFYTYMLKYLGGEQGQGLGAIAPPLPQRRTAPAKITH